MHGIITNLAIPVSTPYLKFTELVVNTIGLMRLMMTALMLMLMMTPLMHLMMTAATLMLVRQGPSLRSLLCVTDRCKRVCNE